MKYLCLIAPLALAACNSGPTVSATNASGEEVVATVKAAGADGQFISPGHWQMAMTVREMTMPGLPPSAAERMKVMMGKARMTETCLTPEQVKQPKGDMFGGEKSCRYDHFTMGGGKIDALMKCNGEEGSRTMSMQGSYSPDTYHMAVASEGKAPGGGGAMSMKMEIDAKRTGACAGKENG